MARVSSSVSPRLLAEVTLRPYAQIILSRDLVSGALVMLAVTTFPRVVLATLLAVLTAQVLVYAAGFGLEAVREGSIACIAVLTALATSTSLGDLRFDLVIAGAILSVLYSAAFRVALVPLALPTHSLPFVAATWTVLLAARSLAFSGSSLAGPVAWSGIPLQLLAPHWLDIPAAILFLSGAAAGGLLLLGIAWHSRIALLLAVVGALMAHVTRVYFRAGLPWSNIDLTASFNAVLTAMVLGGVWFVPQPASIILAAGAALVSCLVTYALFPLTAFVSLPVISLPFVLTTMLVLAAARLRERDRSPATAAPADLPEEALSDHLMRVRRFGEFAWLPFRLPFRGMWTVTQGHSGPHTHKGPWRHAFDFEIRGLDGNFYTGEGKTLTDFLCYGLPVLAAGGGTVEQVIDTVADNPIGGMNAKENWGNVVVIGHGSNLYSVCAHLQPKSVRVKPGDKVFAGAEIGRCGNSGRSVVPHLHFHVQRGATLGSETIPADFGDVVARSDGRTTIAHRVIPREGDHVRPVGRDETLAGALDFPPGSTWELLDRTDGRRETARVELDLLGRRMLRSSNARLYFEPYEAGIVFIAMHGSRESLLRYLLLGMSRTPFDQEASLTWSDRVPRRLLLARVWALLDDLVTVVAPRLADFEVSYVSKRSERSVTIVGEASAFTTRAVISLDDEPHTVSLIRHGHETTIAFSPVAAEVTNHLESAA